MSVTFKFPRRSMERHEYANVRSGFTTRWPDGNSKWRMSRFVKSWKTRRQCTRSNGVSKFSSIVVIYWIQMECPICYTVTLLQKKYQCIHEFCDECLKGPPLIANNFRCIDRDVHAGFCLLCAYDEINELKSIDRHRKMLQVLQVCPMCRCQWWLTSWMRTIIKLNGMHFGVEKVTLWSLAQACDAVAKAHEGHHPNWIP